MIPARRRATINVAPGGPGQPGPEPVLPPMPEPERPPQPEPAPPPIDEPPVIDHPPVDDPGSPAPMST